MRLQISTVFSSSIHYAPGTAVRIVRSVGDCQRSVDSCDIELIADIISLGIADNGSAGNLYRICSGVSARTLRVKTQNSEFVSVNYEIRSLEAGDGLFGSVPDKGAGFCIARQVITI